MRRSRTVISRAASHVVAARSRAGVDLEALELRDELRSRVVQLKQPSSKSVMSATLAIGFVIEYMRKIVSGAIGLPASTSMEP